MLSSFYVGSVEEPIEPLHGIARNPYAQVGCGGMENIFNITYLTIKTFCGEVTPKSVFFDMGASVGFASVPGGIVPPKHGRWNFCVDPFVQLSVLQ